MRSAVYNFNDSALSRPSLDDLGGIVGKPGLVAEVVGAYHDLVECCLQARPLAGGHLQLVELEHHIGGRRQGLVGAALPDEQHTGDVDACNQFLGGGGDVDEHVVDVPQ